MKIHLIFMLAVVTVCQAQIKKTVIKASSKICYIKEDNEEKTKWHLDPKAKPDLYVTNKTPKEKTVTFYTNEDSIVIKLKPGKKFDFAVLLNNTDSCYTRVECPPLQNFSKLKPEIHDTIPFVLSEYNNIIFKVKLDDKETLDLKFDSGTTDFLLTNDMLNQLKLSNLKGHSFKLGNQIWKDQEIYPVELTGQGTVGRFGWNLFDGKIVEIDYDKKLFIIHSKLSKRNKEYIKLDMEFTHTLFCIQGQLQIKNTFYKGRFLFDNGYQRTVMLDQQIMQEQQYPKESLPVIKKVILKNGKGEEVPVITVRNEKLYLGNLCLNDVPVQLLTKDNPARFKTHILGSEVLKRFNTILDFQKNKVYLKPNSLWNEPYTEGS
ncbi:hypothetical protein [Flavobacterium ginsenosidimutans]|uniref:hypothetical protein n=1 Tax=Flavobacterium ginsenosidimutans TaxID=687844 RepID=UPI000DAECABF|nr:hypothetical protein [Flavobacterium ginsenosidimutans]KAF2336637.1 hypothetical protein DM444_03895 [Flavobacterium ginsenosidimutans]